MSALQVFACDAGGFQPVEAFCEIMGASTMVAGAGGGCDGGFAVVGVSDDSLIAFGYQRFDHGLIGGYRKLTAIFECVHEMREANLDGGVASVFIEGAAALADEALTLGIVAEH